MKQDTILMNGRACAFERGRTIFEVAEENGIRIPSLCFLKGASPTGRCRICVVQIEGRRDLEPACSTFAEPGMIVLTESPKVVASRKETLAKMLAHPAWQKYELAFGTTPLAALESRPGDRLKTVRKRFQKKMRELHAAPLLGPVAAEEAKAIDLAWQAVLVLRHDGLIA